MQCKEPPCDLAGNTTYYLHILQITGVFTEDGSQIMLEDMQLSGLSLHHLYWGMYYKGMLVVSGSSLARGNSS